MREVTHPVADAPPKAAAVFAARGVDGTRMEDVVGATAQARSSPPMSTDHIAEDEMTASAIIGAVTMVGLHHVLAGRTVDPPAMSQRLDRLILHGLAPSPGRKDQ